MQDRTRKFLLLGLGAWLLALALAVSAIRRTILERELMADVSDINPYRPDYGDDDRSW